MSAWAFTPDAFHDALQREIVNTCKSQHVYADAFIEDGDGTPVIGWRTDLFVAPDIVGSYERRPFGIEIKTKDCMTFRRVSGWWETGIDADKWDEYVALTDAGIPVTLVFLHRGRVSAVDRASCADKGINVDRLTFGGLYVASVHDLARLAPPREGTFQTNFGRSVSMVYWPIMSADGVRIGGGWTRYGLSSEPIVARQVPWWDVMGKCLRSIEGKDRTLPGRIGDAPLERRRVRMQEIDPRHLPW